MKGVSLRHNLRNKKNNKFKYYSKAYLNRYTPVFSSRNLDRLFKKQPGDELLNQLIDRRDYYCSDLAVGKGGSTVSSVSKYRKPKNYYIDLYQVLRYFPKDYKLNHLFGDIDYAADKASFVKSRPIVGANNSILLKLNHIRHFYFVQDELDLQDKEDELMWRGAIWKRQKQRQLFFDKHGSNPHFNIGLVKGMEEYFPKFEKPFLIVSEQLRYKFILSLEGNDVATNLKWIMSSNSIPIMPKPTCETWFMEGKLVADENYIEIAQDFSDLEEKLEKAINDPSWLKDIVHNNHRYIEKFKDYRQELMLELMVADKALRIMGNEPYLAKRYSWLDI